MLQKIKDNYNNIRRHKILFGLLALSVFMCVVMFRHFYAVRVPYVLRSEINQAMDDHNELVVCTQRVEEMRAAEVAANADIMK